MPRFCTAIDYCIRKKTISIDTQLTIESVSYNIDLKTELSKTISYL